MSETRRSTMADAMLTATVAKLQAWGGDNLTPTAIQVFKRKNKRLIQAINSSPEIPVGHTRIQYADRAIVRRLKGKSK